MGKWEKERHSKSTFVVGGTKVIYLTAINALDTIVDAHNADIAALQSRIDRIVSYISGLHERPDVRDAIIEIAEGRDENKPEKEQDNG